MQPPLLDRRRTLSTAPFLLVGLLAAASVVGIVSAPSLLALNCETMFGPAGWAQAEVTTAAESPISVGVLAVHERPELVDKLWQLITTPLHGLLQHVVYGFTIVVCSRAAPCRTVVTHQLHSKTPPLNFMPTQVGLTDDDVESTRSAGTLCRHRKRPSGGRSHCFGARAAASATSRYNGGFLHMRCSRIKAKLPHPLLVSPAPVRTTRANGRGTMTAGAVLGLRQILYETVRDY